VESICWEQNCILNAVSGMLFSCEQANRGAHLYLLHRLRQEVAKNVLTWMPLSFSMRFISAVHKAKSLYVLSQSMRLHIR
jgi:hypothetical protein